MRRSSDVYEAKRTVQGAYLQVSLPANLVTCIKQLPSRHCKLRKSPETGNYNYATPRSYITFYWSDYPVILRGIMPQPIT